MVGLGTPVGDVTLPPFEALGRRNVRLQGVWVSDVRHTLRAVSQGKDALGEVAMKVNFGGDELVSGRGSMRGSMISGLHLERPSG